MKKELVIILCLAISVSAQDWRKVATQSNLGISGIFFTDNVTGWAVGASGLIYKTTNAGDDWLVKFDDVDSITYRRISFANNNGYAGGKYGNILKTSDGGETWHRQILPGATGDVNAICTYSENEAWVLVNVTDSSKIYHTSNGGLDWQDIYTTSQIANDMHFGEGKNGLVVGKTNAEIYHTEDGINWIKAAQAPLGGYNYSRSNINGVYMVNSTLGYAVGWGSLIGPQPTIHLKTTDGGATWSYLTQVEQNLTYQSLSGVYFRDSENGVAVGGGSGAGGTAARTTDGGINWIAIDIPCGADLKSIKGFDDNLWVCGDEGVILRSSDFGNSWKLLTEIPGTYLYTMQSLSANNIVAAGFSGVFVKSTNNGKDWRGKYVRANNVALNIQDIYFVNEYVGYAAHSYEMLTKTTDGGETWFAVIPNTNNNMAIHYGVFFLDENYGFSVGRIASNVDAIYKTTDGGNSWEIKTNLVSATLKSVAFADKNHGIAVGDKLKAIYTSDGGNTWNPSTFVTLPSGTSAPSLERVVFKDNINAIASGVGIILNSTDGGATWNYAPVENLVETITGLSFKDSQTGWAVGTKLTKPRSIGLYETTDGGLTWINQVDSATFLKPEFVNGSVTNPFIYDVSIQGEYTWICGNSSDIYTNEPEVVSVDSENNLPESIYLSQNYPNPFNPSTKISFNLSEGSNITLKIYDLLGREVKSIINEYKSAGSHEINLKADDLSSGTYFYVLRSGALSISKKMMMLK